MIQQVLPFEKTDRGSLSEPGVNDEKIVHSIVEPELLNRVDILYSEYRHHPIEENCILFESQQGEGMICNPYALFRYLLNNPDYSGYKHVWILTFSICKEDSKYGYIEVLFVVPT